MMNEFLQLRHKMVPYLYTMNYRAYAQDTPLVLPMYYYNPRCLESYRVPNEYYFGTGLIVAPITSPRLSGLNRAKERVWLPEGTFIDSSAVPFMKAGRMNGHVQGYQYHACFCESRSCYSHDRRNRCGEYLRKSFFSDA